MSPNAPEPSRLPRRFIVRASSYTLHVFHRNQVPAHRALAGLSDDKSQAKPQIMLLHDIHKGTYTAILDYNDLIYLTHEQPNLADSEERDATYLPLLQAITETVENPTHD